MKIRIRTQGLVLALAALGYTGLALAQDVNAMRDVTDARLQNPEPENWLMFRRTYDGWGYSPLNDINTRNVDNLKVAWTLSTGVTEGHQSPPIVNDGIMYITTPLNLVYAVDATNGNVIWQYRQQLPFDLSLMHPTNRGVALYGDKVFMATSDAKLVALNARTGAVEWEKVIEDYHTGYYITMAPLAAKGKVMVGVSGGERGIRGFITALDVNTGDEVWKTYTVPAPGEPGSETWPEGMYEHGGASVWVTGNFDPEKNLTYWGTGNAGPWIGDARPGDNLFANSVLALDVDTGQMKGYHQYHWNDSWDWDEVSTPMLMDITRNGETFPALVHPGRNGYLWTLKREDDGSISYVDAKPFVYQNVFKSLDAITGRPEYNEGTKPGLGVDGTYCPSLSGGKNWTPAAYSPDTKLVYIPANDNYCTTMGGQPVEYRPGQNYTGNTGIQASILEGTDYIGEVQAWDMEKGEKVWSQKFDMANWGPMMATGGNLVFSGGTADRYFRAYDARNGRILWQERLNSGITGVPTTYEVDGKQYIAIQSGWGVDASRMQRAIDGLKGQETIVPQGGVLWVFALE
jgi:alcohol dehydrogenase (cytochrome c)